MAPLCSESRLLPDHDVLRERMVSIALEHGLLGGIKVGVADIIMAGLEHHLKNNIAAVIRNARGNAETGFNGSDASSMEEAPRIELPREQNTLTPRELAVSWTIQPHRLVEAQPALKRLELSMADDTLVSNCHHDSTTSNGTRLDNIVDGSPGDDAQSPYWEQRVELANILDDILMT